MTEAEDIERFDLLYRAARAEMVEAIERCLAAEVALERMRAENAVLVNEVTQLRSRRALRIADELARPIRRFGGRFG